MTKAELTRRLQVGVKIQVVEHYGRTPSGPFAEVATVAAVKSFGVELSRPTWDAQGRGWSRMTWKEDKAILDRPDGFAIQAQDGQTIEYRWAP